MTLYSGPCLADMEASGITVGSVARVSRHIELVVSCPEQESLPQLSTLAEVGLRCLFTKLPG